MDSFLRKGLGDGLFGITFTKKESKWRGKALMQTVHMITFKNPLLKLLPIQATLQVILISIGVVMY